MRLRRDRAIYGLTMTAAGAAVLAVLAPWSIPLGPVPLTLCTLVIYVMAWLFDPLPAVLIYVLLGAAGLPVFSGFSGGFGCLLGPVGGYILGYLPLCALCGLFVRRFEQRRWLCLLGMGLGTAVLYAVGTGWFCVQTGRTLREALMVCVLPFLPGDLLKMLAAVPLGSALRSRLERTGLLKR